MAVFTQDSQLPETPVGGQVDIILGTSEAGDEWYIPSGFQLPPGLRLNPTTGRLRGVPTIPGTYHFYISAKGTSGTVTRDFLIRITQGTATSTSRINELIARGFQIGMLPGAAWGIDTEIDEDGRTVLALKATIQGQERTIASIRF